MHDGTTLGDNAKTNGNASNVQPAILRQDNRDRRDGMVGIGVLD